MTWGDSRLEHELRYAERALSGFALLEVDPSAAAFAVARSGIAANVVFAAIESTPLEWGAKFRSAYWSQVQRQADL